MGNLLGKKTPQIIYVKVDSRGKQLINPFSLTCYL